MGENLSTQLALDTKLVPWVESSPYSKKGTCSTKPQVFSQRKKKHCPYRPCGLFFRKPVFDRRTAPDSRNAPQSYHRSRAPSPRPLDRRKRQNRNCYRCAYYIVLKVGTLCSSMNLTKLIRTRAMRSKDGTPHAMRHEKWERCDVASPT